MINLKFRKKPVVIEAEQFREAKVPWPVGVRVIGADGAICIDTLEGVHHVSEGDWIITGVEGEKYPCKPDIFEQTYEKVDET